MTAYDWPAAFARVQTELGTGDGTVAAPDAVGRALASFSPGAAAQPQPRLHDILSTWTQPVWLRLSEAASDTDRAVLTAKLMGAVTRLHQMPAVDGMLLNIGGNGDGDVGLAVGLTRQPSASVGWAEGVATELIFEPGEPFGWSQLGTDSPERALLGVASNGLARDQQDSSSRPTFLELLLGSTGSLGPWSVDLVLRPLPLATSEMLREEAVRCLFRAGLAVNRTLSQTESTSATYTLTSAERLVSVLEQWHALADDCLTNGGWTVATRARAARVEDLASITAAFTAALSDQTHVSHPTRRQVWTSAGVSRGAPESSTWLSSRDIADVLMPSGASVGGMQMRRSLASGRQMRATTKPIELGTWLGTSLPARIDLDDLSAHGFIAGITGSGKSTTTRTLLSQLANRHQKPFLVIDPAKTDYADFGIHLEQGLRVVQGRDLRMNVLRALPGCDPAQHIARVSHAFRGSFGMPSPVPYVASILFEELAQEAAYSEVTLHDARARLESLVGELNYRGEIEDNIKASLGLRLRLLLQPSRADRVACFGVAPDWLTDRPTVVQLGDIADEEERNFLAAMLVLYVSDAARRRGLCSTVEHLTVIEEAHRLMPEPREVSADEGDAGSVSAKLMAQLLAEVRAYGESLLIIDQSPAAVSREVLRNTNVKLVHRIVDRDDQRSLGGALGLDEEDSAMLGSLAVGRLLVSSRQFVQPQTAVVKPALQVFEVTDLGENLDHETTACHGRGRSEAHHRSEAWGQEVELAVALWLAGSRTDPREAAAVLAAREPGTQAACLLRIGLLRHVRTLRRLGRFDPGEVVERRDELWGDLLNGREPSVLFDKPANLPFAVCSQCPSPCRARPVIATAALHSVRHGYARVASLSGEEAAGEIFNVVKAVGSEIGSSPITPAVMICAAAHLAREVGADELVLNKITQG